MLDEPATQSIGLALHELATNAAKYGALSVPQGRVTIEWELTGKPGEACPLQLRWRERNGPKVQKPARKGFGHIVMERTLADSLQGDVKLDFAPDGLRWEAEIPPTASTSSTVRQPGRRTTAPRLRMHPIRH